MVFAGYAFAASWPTYAQESQNKKHIEVSLRMIGHQVLLNSGDSTSRVLPIIVEDGKYVVQFESEFEFKPMELVNSVNRVIQETDLANSYIVEVATCSQEEIVYSYEVGESESRDIIPCGVRLQPKSCYKLFFTLMDVNGVNDNLVNSPSGLLSNADWSDYLLLLVLILLTLIVLGFLWQRRKRLNRNPNLIRLGEFHFDKLNNLLIMDDQQNELTSKEADLLLLLYNDVNTTVEREVILNRVWGDEGDYVGRTLDVFISKLRKKLEVDSKVKIVNIRGIGYKLVMDV